MIDSSAPVPSPNYTDAPAAALTSANTSLTVAPWSLALRIAFRFCFVYLGLFCVTNQPLVGMFTPALVDVPSLCDMWPLRQTTVWVAVHLFRMRSTLVIDDVHTSDKTFDWIFLFISVIVSIVATAVWSLLDRKRSEYAKLHAYFRLFVRIALVVQLLTYGLAKVIPIQMPYPALFKFVEPFGYFSPEGVLWTSIGAAQAYEIFAGFAETTAGVLLIFPRTTMLGALLAMADMTQVFMLNMAYDVPVKIVSFHLLLLALFLLAPDVPRLWAALFSDQPVPARTPSPILRSRRAQRIALAIQVIYAVAIVGLDLKDGYRLWFIEGGAHPRSPFYGIWEVEEYSVDGQLRQPLITDNERWHRMIVDYPDALRFQLMDDSFVRYLVALDPEKRSLVLTTSGRKDWQASFRYLRPAPEQLDLDGEMDSHKIHAQMRLIDLGKKYPLVASKFRWVIDYPAMR
jgi:uncharacterized membrane protein YphA (DoxX/SURF4 family)